MSNALLDKIIKNSPSKYVSVLSESELFGDKDIIPTELPILNVAFSGKLDGGLVSGLTVLAGASKSFKSLMALFCIKAYLDKYDDAVAIIYDSEGGVTPEYLTSIGIDPARVVHIPIEHLEMLKFDMVKTLKSIERTDKIIMMIDSIGNTASLKELEDAENEKSVAEMQRAKSMKALFRMVTPSLVAKDVPCIAIAHVYQTMELYSKTIISGGSGLIYSANQAFIITKSQDKDADGLQGWNFNITIEKSRYVREKAKLSFNVRYDKGINKWSGLLDLATEAGMVEKVRKRSYVYHYIDPITGEIDPTDYSEADTNTSTFWNRYLTNDKFKQFVEDKYSLNGQLMMNEEDNLTAEDIEDLAEES